MFALKSAMARASGVRKHLDVKEIKQNTFLFTFEDANDRLQVLGDGPWNFNGNHVVLKEWLSNQRIQDVDFSRHHLAPAPVKVMFSNFRKIRLMAEQCRNMCWLAGSFRIGWLICLHSNRRWHGRREYARHLDVKENKQNTFLFTFEDANDRLRVLGDGPWNFSRNHVVLKEWLSNQRIQDVDFSRSEFWI
ncbi:hypothetical protein Tsubulata_035000 [Turnera subulata]|uniref:DUF4283 domain-containing protein n=1 Tax=Turnera subulata TaxID=218843 RepID=A0A9Q0FWX1_9ROSI|nr:hypothetical protein Tsubulata_035000 [Turnera subulata]